MLQEAIYQPVFLPRSGGTPEFPSLIQYACDLMTNVRVVSPAIVTVPPAVDGGAKGSNGGELMSSVLGGRPVLALAFEDMVVSSKLWGQGF